MLKHPLLAWLCVQSLVLMISGCALSPQQLSPRPEVDTEKLQLKTHGRPIRLVVNDGRTQEVIGTRGGIYGSSSTLTVPTNDILPKIKTQVERAVHALGFVPGEDSNAPQLTVTLTLLDYQTTRSGINALSNVRAILTADTQNGGRRYQGVHTAMLSKGFPNSPDKRANDQLLTQVLSDALDRVFADQGIVQELLIQ